MAEKIGVTVDCAQQMAEVVEYVQKLFETYGDYVSFQFHCGAENVTGENYDEGWGLYNPIIGHKRFGTSKELIGFVKKMINDEDLLYYNHRKNKLLEEKVKLLDRIETVNEELATLEGKIRSKT